MCPPLDYVLLFWSMHERYFEGPATEKFDHAGKYDGEPTMRDVPHEIEPASPPPPESLPETQPAPEAVSSIEPIPPTLPSSRGRDEKSISSAYPAASHLRPYADLPKDTGAMHPLELVPGYDEIDTRELDSSELQPTSFVEPIPADPEQRKVFLAARAHVKTRDVPQERPDSVDTPDLAA